LPLAASLERAVTDSAELLLAVGIALALLFALTRNRIGIVRWPLLGACLLALGVGTALGGWAWHENRDRTVRGSPTKEFIPTQAPKKRPRKEITEEPWPVYGYNVERTRAAPFKIRPPYGGLWKLRTKDALEGPPVVAYGRIFFVDQHGKMFALKSRTGKIVWKRNFRNCAAASAAVSRGVIYQPFMHPEPCVKNAPGARGFIAALDAKTGKTLWKFKAGPVESAPLIVGRRLYFGSWDRRVYAIDLRRKRNRLVWSYETDDKVVAAPAYANGTIFAATNGGRIYALNARTGSSAGAPSPSRASAAASTSMRRPRLPTGGSSPATPTAPSMPTAPAPGTCSGRARSAPTCTRRRPSGGRCSSSARGTGTSPRST
jgi:hypothetical protein